MNLWIFNHYAVTPDLTGGTRHYDLGRELARRGHRVTVFSSSFTYSKRREEKLQSGHGWRVEDFDGLKFVWVKTFPYKGNDWRRFVNMLSYAFHSWRLGHRLPELSPGIERPDVIIGSSVHLLAVLTAYRLAGYYRAPFIMEVRDLWPQTLFDMGELSPTNPVSRVLRTLERFLYRKAARIITVLPKAHEYIGACGIPLEKIVWIPNGVDLSRYEDNEMARSAPGKFKLMYVGAHGRANQLETIIQAAKLAKDKGFPDLKFVLVGDGPEKRKLVSLSQELGLVNVEFRPPIQKSEVFRTLLEADAFIVNLGKLAVFKYGISPNKLYDYMAAGRPIVFSVEASNNPIREASCGLTVPPGDPQALAEAVIELAQIPGEERRAMGRRARAYVEKYHSIPVLADQLVSCLEGLP